MSTTSCIPPNKGSLVVIGTGIALGQLTAESRSHIETADKVLFCVSDAATERLITRLKPDAETLYKYYADHKNRSITYEEMVERTLECVREGMNVCMIFYGHPGIFVYPSHEAIRRARKEGYEARMLPAVSSLDCLFSDLGIDPAAGCQMLEATDFLLRKRALDIATHVILWQIGCVGDLGFNFKGFDGRHIPTLTSVLCDLYGPDHIATMYEAAQYAVCDPLIKRIRLSELPSAGATGITTLYIPPKDSLHVDLQMAKRLGVYDVIKDKMVRANVSTQQPE